jgi:hypothetical protein
VTDIANRQQSFTSSRPHAARPHFTGKAQREADAPFLRRILFGLIVATVLSGAVTVALTTQHEVFERFQIASAHGPA